MSDQILQKLKQAIIESNVTEILIQSMALSLAMNASDIHIEPRKSVVIIRLRVDGVLRIIVEYPQNTHPGVVSKIKIMANLKIDESRVPQDGRITTFIGEKEVDLRVSSLPTPHGEKIVMRVVDKSKKIPELQDLGIRGRNYDLLHKAINEPNGIILTTGPTGSGKTTTMYSVMSVLNQPERNIMTFEDPIENQMEGLNQSQIRSDIGYTFANGLRTALRQDPDVIMVGEIRDKETIDIAIEAALTGHLVLSTIHTNSAVQTITRILNMKVPDFLVTASVNLIIAQRLARRLCAHCKVMTPPSNDAQKKLGEVFRNFRPSKDIDMNIFNHPQIYSHNPNGCEKCDGNGYKGRVGIYEVLEMSPTIKETILSGAPAMKIQEQASEAGMITLEQDGLLKVLQGHTTFEEVYKLTN